MSPFRHQDVRETSQRRPRGVGLWAGLGVWLLGVLFLSLSPVRVVYAAGDPVTCAANMPGGLNFGTIDALSPNNTDVISTLNIQCQSHVRQWYYVTVCFNIGEGANPLTGANRTLLSGSNALSYQIYSDAARTQIWGSVNSSVYPNPVRLDFYLGGRQTYSQNLSVYGRLFGSQNTAPTGLYQDSYTNPQVRITGVLTYNYGGGTCDSFGQDAGAFSPVTVSGTVGSNCLVNASNLNFGTASLISGAIASTSTLGVQCTNGTAYQVGLSNGQHSVGSQRYMTSGTNQVAYGLFQDSAHTRIWDDGTSRKSGVGSGQVVNQTVFGLVPSQPTVPAGSYSDTVQVNVSY